MPRERSESADWLADEVPGKSVGGLIRARSKYRPHGSQDDCRARRDRGEHAIVRACGEIVDFHSHDGVCSHRLGAGAHLVDGGRCGVADLLLVLGGASAEHVRQARAEVLEHVDAGERFARDHPDVLLDGRAFDRWGRDH